MDNLSFYSKHEYFAELDRCFKQAGSGSRILLMSMSFEPDVPPISDLWASLEGAAARGADITVGIDARSFLDNNGRVGSNGLPGPLWFHRQLPAKLAPPYEARRAAIERLSAYQNAHVVVMNKPGRLFSLTIAGRSHIKIAIIDDNIFIGGCNLDEPDYIDITLGWRNQQNADELYALFRHIIEGGNAKQALTDGAVAKDRIIPIDAETNLLVDAGVRDQSIIFSQALDLIDSAQEWLTITCQYFPNSVTAQHLLAAKKRGVKVEILFAHPKQHGFTGSMEQYVSQMIERSRLPAHMFNDGLGAAIPKLHAKLIACDKGMMIGSHNYVRAGVRLGTAEIALRSSNVGLARQAADKIQAEINQLTGRLKRTDFHNS